MKSHRTVFLAHLTAFVFILAACSDPVPTTPQIDVGSNFTATFIVDEGSTLNFDLAPYTKGNKFAVSAETTRGKLTFDEQGLKGTFVAPDFSAGEDTFVIQWEGPNGPLTGVVRITIRRINHPPKTYDVPLLVLGEQKTHGKLIAKDYDGDHLTFSITTPTTKGSVVLNADSGEFDYTPNPAAVGTDSFSYEVSDGKGLSDRGIQLIAINSDRKVAILETRDSSGTTTPPLTAATMDSVVVGNTVSKTFYVHNAGGVTATEVKVQLSDQHYQVVNNCPVQLTPRQSCDFVVTFKPLLAGNLRGDLSLSYISDSRTINTGVALSGIGLRPAKLTYQMVRYTSPGFTNVTMVPGRNYSFGDISSPSPVLNVILTNSGDVTASISAINLSSRTLQTSFEPAPTLPMNLMPGSSVTLNLKMNSPSSGAGSELFGIRYENGTSEVIDEMVLGANVVSPILPTITVIANQGLPAILGVDETYSIGIQITNNDTHARLTPELLFVPAYAVVSQTATTCGATLNPSATCTRTFSVKITQPSETPMIAFHVGDQDSWLELYEGVYSGGTSVGKVNQSFAAQRVRFRGSLGLAPGSNGIFPRTFYLHDNAAQRTKVVTLKALTGAVNKIQASVNADFEFLGGSYPGKGGTCDNSLAVNQSCTVVLYSTSNQQTTSTGVMRLRYHDRVDQAISTDVNLSQELFGCLDAAVPMTSLPAMPATRRFWGVSPHDGLILSISDNSEGDGNAFANLHYFRCDGAPLGNMQLTRPVSTTTPPRSFELRMLRFIPGTSKFVVFEYTLGHVAIIDPIAGTETVLDIRPRLPHWNLRNFHPMLASDGTLAVVVGAFDSSFNYVMSTFRYDSNGVFVGTGPGFRIPREQVPWDYGTNSIAYPFTSNIDADNSSTLIYISQNATRKTHVFRLAAGSNLSYQVYDVAELDPCLTQNVYTFTTYESARDGDFVYPFSRVLGGQTCVSKLSTQNFNFFGRTNIDVLYSPTKGFNQNNLVANSVLKLAGTRVTATCSPRSCQASYGQDSIYSLNLSTFRGSWQTLTTASGWDATPTFLFGNAYLTPPVQRPIPQVFSRGVAN